MEKKNRNVKANATAFGLKHELGPCATKFAEYLMNTGSHYKEYLKEILTEKWGGVLPKSLLWTADEVSISVMNILCMMMDFAIEEAKRRENYDGFEEGLLRYHVEPNYGDRSTMLITHRGTKTVLLHMKRSTSDFNPKTIEFVLRKMVEETCEGIDLVRKRKKLNDKI